MATQHSPPHRRFERYVALGDSSTEGLDDPHPDGGYRGWADRLAEHITRVQGSLRYANLGVRGRRTRQIRDQQLAVAVAMRPDLVTLFSGTNDVVARSFDLEDVAGDIEHIHRVLIDHSETGVTVLTFTLPDLSPVMPLGRLVAARVEALNEALREIAGRTGAVLVDFARYPLASDPRLWSADRLHANAAGHARIAGALAAALGLPESDMSWADALPDVPRRSIVGRLRGEAAWIRGHLLPWIWRHSRGESSGDGRAAKRPELTLLEASGHEVSR